MAFTSTTEWDCRVSGSDLNGGGFNVGAAGTDYSQQDSPQVTYTDLVIDGTTNTKCTSAATPFTSAHVGNIINVTSGTGFTVQRAQIVSVASAVATCDKSLGTLGSTGGNGKLGGAVATIATALGIVANGNTVWVKSGTYTLTAQLAPPASANFSLIGFNSTHGDNGTAPTITTATNSTILISIASSLTSAFVHNCAFTTTATTKAPAIQNASTSGPTLTVSNCSFDSFTTTIAGLGGVIGQTWGAVHLLNSSIKNSSSSAITYGGSLYMENCYISGSGASQINTTSGSSATTIIVRCLIVAGTTHGINIGSSGVYARIIDSTIAGNGGDGVHTGASSWSANMGAVIVQNCILYGNTGYGVSFFTSVPRAIYLRNNAVGGNTSGDYNNAPAGSVGDVTLTAAPFTNSGSGDYSLNSTAGGGAACKGVGYPGAFPGGTTTGYLDIGAAQSLGSSGSSGAANYGFMG